MVGMSKARAENRTLPKRFYTQATTENGRIFLDGRELKTQARNPLVITPQALADAVAAEWDAVEKHIDPDRMPLTRLANLAIDRTPRDRAALIDSIVTYAGTDLLCYRDPELAGRQAAAFDPVLIWAAGQGVALDITEAIMPIAQPEASLARLRAHMESASDWELTALAMMVPLLGSAVLALAVWKGEVPVDDALAMARLDETTQAEKWGADAEAQAAWEYKKKDIMACATLLAYHRA